MANSRLALLLAALILGAATAARAQEHGKFGVVMGYPAAVGVVFHVNDSVAIRPDVIFEAGASEAVEPASAAPNESSGSAYTAGVSILFFLRSTDNVRAYISPRIAYSRRTSETSSSPFGGTRLEIDSTATGTHFGGSVGAQYTPSRRFAVFGEIGLAYVDQTSVSETSPLTGFAATRAEAKGNSFGTRGGVGVIFYF